MMMVEWLYDKVIITDTGSVCKQWNLVLTLSPGRLQRRGDKCSKLDLDIHVSSTQAPIRDAR